MIITIIVTIRMEYKFIDLFCGIGGFHQALAKLNAKCVFACDIDENCRITYEKNYHIKPESDITKIDISKIPAFDILCGGFPCFVAGTKVLTFSGYKNIEDVEIIDKLMTHTGKFQTIINLQRKIFTGNIYDIQINHHSESITCTEEHPFYVREKKSEEIFDNPVWKKANELTVNDYFGMVINSNKIIPEFTFDKTNIKLDKLEYWFMFGCLVGDGCTKKNKEEIFDKIHKIIPFNDIICSNIFEMFCKYANDKLIPEWVQDAPKELVQEFINGYMRAYCKNGSVSYNLEYGLQRLHLKLGSISTTREKNVASFIEDNYVWYKPFKMIKNETLNIPVYNFEVENDNSYIVMNTIVHNCQSFSKSGHQKGFDDTRGTLFFNMCDIIERHNPKYLLLENVRNLATHDDGETWKVIKKRIDELGYNTYELPVILNVLHFNIPQNRERVIIMCKRKDLDLGQLPQLPTISKNPKGELTNHIKDFLRPEDEESNKKYKIDGKMKDVEIIWHKFIRIVQDNDIMMPKFPIWTEWWDKDLVSNPEFYKKYTNWIDKNIAFYNDNQVLLKPWLDSSRENKNWIGAVRKFEWQSGTLIENDGMDKVLWTARGSGIRVKRPDYIPTLVAMSMIPVYGPESRKLSPRELLRLQSFPENFIFDEKKILKQVGNAVNVKMIEQCARFFIFEEQMF